MFWYFKLCTTPLLALLRALILPLNNAYEHHRSNVPHAGIPILNPLTCKPLTLKPQSLIPETQNSKVPDPYKPQTNDPSLTPQLCLFSLCAQTPQPIGVETRSLNKNTGFSWIQKYLIMVFLRIFYCTYMYTIYKPKSSILMLKPVHISVCGGPGI